MIIIYNMNKLRDTILDLLMAVLMQISIWRRKMRMINKYGFDRRYKKS